MYQNGFIVVVIITFLQVQKSAVLAQIFERTILDFFQIFQTEKLVYVIEPLRVQYGINLHECKLIPY